VRTQRSATAFARGARNGVSITRTPSERTSRVERPAELRIPIMDQEPHVLQPFIDREVPCLLGHPGAVRVGGHPGEVNAPRPVFDPEQHVQRPQPDSLDGEEIAGQQPMRLRTQELRPARAASPRRPDPAHAPAGARGSSSHRPGRRACATRPGSARSPSAGSRAPTARPAPAARDRAAAGPTIGADTSTSAAQVPAANAEASAATPRTPTTAPAAAGRSQPRAQHDPAVATPAASPTAAGQPALRARLTPL